MSSAESRPCKRGKPGSEPPDWSYLSPDMLEKIAGCLTNGVDYVRFRAVCRSWRRSAPKISQLPWAVLSCKDAGGNRAIRFFDVTFSQVLRLPNADRALGKMCCGCSRGWMGLICPSMDMFLLNPITGVEVRLPRFTVFPDYCSESISREGEVFVFRGRLHGHINSTSRFEDMVGYLPWNLILSSEPTDPGCVAMAIICYCEHLAFCHPSDKSWTQMDEPPCPISDLIFYDGVFYGVCLAVLFKCDPQNRTVHQIVLAADYDYNYEFQESYFLESSGSLLLAGTIDSVYGLRRVFVNLDLRNVQMRLLMNLSHLRNRAFFLSNGNQAISVTGSHYRTCTANCITFHFRKAQNEVHLFFGSKIPGYISTNGDETASDWEVIAWFKPNISRIPQSEIQDPVVMVSNECASVVPGVSSDNARGCELSLQLTGFTRNPGPICFAGNDTRVPQNLRNHWIGSHTSCVTIEIFLEL